MNNMIRYKKMLESLRSEDGQRFISVKSCVYKLSNSFRMMLSLNKSSSTVITSSKHDCVMDVAAGAQEHFTQEQFTAASRNTT